MNVDRQIMISPYLQIYLSHLFLDIKMPMKYFKFSEDGWLILYKTLKNVVIQWFILYIFLIFLKNYKASTIDWWFLMINLVEKVLSDTVSNKNISKINKNFIYLFIYFWFKVIQEISLISSRIYFKGWFWIIIIYV